MDEKFYDTVNHAINKHRGYHHSTEKNLSTNKKKKSVKRSTSYKSTPVTKIDIETYIKMVIVATYAIEEVGKVPSRGPYLENVLNSAQDLVNNFKVIDE